MEVYMRKLLSIHLLLMPALLFNLHIKSAISDYIPQSIKDHPYAAGIVTTAALGTSYFTYHYFYGYEQRWDWNTIDTDNLLQFPNNFLWGTASSALQTEGRKSAHNRMVTNSWTAWEKEKKIVPEDHMGEACHHWDYYKEDIQLAKNIDMNAYRFSIEWSKIQPEKDVFDRDAMQHYIDYARELIKQGLQPIPTLFHHAWPTWLEAGFETEESIEAFKNFAVYVFEAFKKAGLLNNIKLWLTFNEPAGYTLAAYVHSKYPPGKFLHLKQAGIVLKNMLDAHIAVYDAFKEIDPDVKVGLAHMMQPIKPYNPWNPFDQLPAKIFDYLLNNVTLIYLQTGKFNWLRLVNDYNPNASGKVDFIGINYYAFTLLKNFKEAKRPYELTADADEGTQGKAIYAEGFYEALKKVAQLIPSKPIIVTENGCATQDPTLRDLYFKRHLYAMHKAMNEGVPIYGYLIWTLTDCYGWNGGNKSTYGLYFVDWKSQERTLKDGVQYLCDVIEESKKSADKLVIF
jgi:beta-glucosidase